MSPRKTVGYVRVSTERQAEEGVSLGAQEAKIRAIAVEAGRTLLLEKAALIDLAERSTITLIGQL